MSKDEREPPAVEGPTPSSEPPPPFRPDPDLITYLERDAKPGEVKVWIPDEGVTPTTRDL